MSSTHTITHNLNNSTLQNTITIFHILDSMATPPMKYVNTATGEESYPGITVTNGTFISYSYDYANSIGTLIINGDDSTTVEINCPITHSGGGSSD